MTYVSYIPWSSWWGGVKLRDELKSAGSSLEGPIFFVLVTAVCLGLVTVTSHFAVQV